MIKAVFFDLWSTLVFNDTEIHPVTKVCKVLHWNILINDFFALHNKSRMSVEKISIKEGFRDFLKQNNVPFTEEQLEDIVYIWTNLVDDIGVYPDTFEILEYCYEHEGLKVGLISGTDQSSFEQADKRHSLSDYLDYVIVSYAEGFTKPDEEFYNIILERTRFKPEEILMVGDSEDMDIVPAKKLGMKTCHINRWDKKSETADFEVNTLAEVKNVVASLL